MIQIEAYLKRKRKYFSTNIYVFPSQWDARKQRICGHAHSEELNWMLAERVVEMEQMEIALWKRGESISLRKLKECTCNSASPQFLPFMARAIERGHIRESTKENRFTTYCLLSEYSEDITFEGLTPYFVSKFEAWMVSRGYHTNTIAKHLSHLRIYVNMAVMQGIIREEDNPFHKRRIGHEPFKHTHLLPFEVEKLEHVKFPAKCQHLQVTTDAFLFCCYTGLRYSDFVRLGSKNVHKGAGHTWLYLKAQKTGSDVELPIDVLFGGKPMHLLDKYADCLDKFFGLPSNSTVDKQLLAVARHAGIRKHFSFHSARHTNATLLLAQGVSVTTVQKLLGHKNVKTTMNYCEVINQTIIKELKKCRKR